MTNQSLERVGRQTELGEKKDDSTQWENFGCTVLAGTTRMLDKVGRMGCKGVRGKNAPPQPKTTGGKHTTGR
jgi:hypothetical protein